ELERLRQRNCLLTKRNHALTMHVSRTPLQKAHAVKTAQEQMTRQSSSKSSFLLKENNIITEDSRAMIRELVADLDVPVASIQGVIKAVAEGLQVPLEGRVSQRSIGRIVKEGGVAADVQLVDEVLQAQGITFSSDGTTHKNINYQSRHITYTSHDGLGITRFAGIQHEVDHTSQTQLDGWKAMIANLYSTYNACMNGSLDPRQFMLKVKGFLTDHAEDQKKLVRLFVEWKRACERDIRGETALKSMPPDDVIAILWQMTQDALSAVGGLEGWTALPPDEQNTHASTAVQQLHVKIGQDCFSKLTESEKETADFFVWAGCCMHKELNAVKGGNTGMQAWWALNDITGPVVLMNRDNMAAAAGGSSSAQARAAQVSQRGATKALSLAGAVFHHKDDKKGQQDSLRCFLETQLGYFCPGPTRAIHTIRWLVHQELYITYLEIIMDKKDSRTHTNIECNVLSALRCRRTTEEIACLAVWGQCISHPYLRSVRGSMGSDNMLDLGPLHIHLIVHIKRLIANVKIIIGPEASYLTASLDGKPFERPEAVYTIMKLASNVEIYPNLAPLLVAFLEGALETAIRFTSEFARDGAITKMTSEQRQLARMNTTNDVNEGALGTLRTSMWQAPCMSLAHFNAQFKYKKNRTDMYIKTCMSRNAQKYLQKKARLDDASGHERKRRTNQAQHDAKVVQRNWEKDRAKRARHEAMQAKLDAVEPCVVSSQIAKMHVVDIDLQLRWHRRLDPQVPQAKDLKTSKKAEKICILQGAAARYLSRGTGMNTAVMEDGSGVEGPGTEDEPRVIGLRGMDTDEEDEV
ncbi:hypothetical protein BU15DRAFT_53177, partial [Melanogaster broomeanus]